MSNESAIPGLPPYLKPFAVNRVTLMLMVKPTDFVDLESVRASGTHAQPKRTLLRRLRGRLFKRWDKHPLLFVGGNTYGEGNFRIHTWDSLSLLIVGDYCSIADEVHVLLGGNHRLDWVTTFPFAEKPTLKSPIGHRLGESPTSKGDVVIGNDVWIGSHASIMSGVTIGDGAAVAAFAHVVSDVEPYELVGGNPARRIRHRFDSETIAQLLDIAWWDWPSEVVLTNSHLLTSPPTENNLARMRRISDSLGSL